VSNGLRSPQRGVNISNSAGSKASPRAGGCFSALAGVAIGRKRSMDPAGSYITQSQSRIATASCGARWVTLRCTYTRQPLTVYAQGVTAQPGSIQQSHQRSMERFEVACVPYRLVYHGFGCILGAYETVRRKDLHITVARMLILQQYISRINSFYTFYRPRRWPWSNT